MLTGVQTDFPAARRGNIELPGVFQNPLPLQAGLSPCSSALGILARHLFRRHLISKRPRAAARPIARPFHLDRRSDFIRDGTGTVS
jgi:hypothetical protein